MTPEQALWLVFFAICLTLGGMSRFSQWHAKRVEARSLTRLEALRKVVAPRAAGLKSSLRRIK